MRRLFYPAMLALVLVSCGIGVDEAVLSGGIYEIRKKGLSRYRNR